ncbi:MAG TPA: hypothetical protein PKD70_06240 [Saprospiraceae bacterium]|nr:hypothetical protein [Saprospiraceae bacterium]HMP13457.1 hypothetical protein [Saprospiraceae bacterium]
MKSTQKILPVKIRIAGAGGKSAYYTKKSCHASKAEADKEAKTFRDKGTTARVLKSGKNLCVYTGPRAKNRGRKKK